MNDVVEFVSAMVTMFIVFDINNGRLTTKKCDIFKALIMPHQISKLEDILFQSRIRVKRLMYSNMLKYQLLLNAS